MIQLTNHALDRLRERHDRHLLRYKDYDGFKRSCRELFERATVTRRHVNDTAFMVRMQEKYGVDVSFSFREYLNVLFVIVNDDRVVTVLDTDVHATSRVHGRVKRF